MPTRRRRKVLFRADGAGATRERLAWITSGAGNKSNTWEYSVDWSRDEDFWTALAKVPAKAWTPALDTKGEPRKDAALVEITDLLGLSGWPEGLRIVVRREPVHPKYAEDLKPYEVATGFRYQVIATNTSGRQMQWLDARYRVHAEVESGIRRSKALTLTRLPSAKFALNQAWCTLLALAMDLLAWLQLLALDGKLTRAEPATIRTAPFDIPAKLTEHARRRELKLDPPGPPAMPWSGHGTASRHSPAPVEPHAAAPTHRKEETAAPSARGSRRLPRRHAVHRPDQHRSHRRTN